MKLAKNTQKNLTKWLEQMEKDYTFFRDDAAKANAKEVEAKRDEDLDYIYLLEYVLKDYFKKMNKEEKS